MLRVKAHALTWLVGIQTQVLLTCRPSALIHGMTYSASLSLHKCNSLTFLIVDFLRPSSSTLLQGPSIHSPLLGVGWYLSVWIQSLACPQVSVLQQLLRPLGINLRVGPENFILFWRDSRRSSPKCSGPNLFDFIILWNPHPASSLLGCFLFFLKQLGESLMSPTMLHNNTGNFPELY